MVYCIGWCDFVVSVRDLDGLVGLFFLFKEVEIMSNMQESTVLLKASLHIASYRFVTSDLEQTKALENNGFKDKGL